ncbi:MAG: putative PEP-binding protein, partial [Stenotrophomonas sp.]
AADRNNDAVAELYSPLHPAVLRLLYQVIETAQRHETPVAVCGEMAGDARMTALLLALGLTEFSLHPATLLEVRRAIREVNLAELRLQAPQLLAARDRRGIERWITGSAGN